MILTERTTAPPRLQCMEIWGGNEAIDDAVAVSGINAYVISRPFGDDARGGDIHYVSTCGHGHIARFAVMDVSGHGAEVSELAAKLRRLMRKHINKLDQTKFVRVLNEELDALNEEGKFATALLTSYYAPIDHLVVCNAGHPPPLWYRASEGRWEWLRNDSDHKVDKLLNLPLGIFAPTEYSQFAVKLDKDDLVLIYTDWMIEARGPDGKLLGDDGALRLVSGIDPSDPVSFARRVVDVVASYSDHAPPDDDATLILLHHTAGNPARRSLTEIAAVYGKALGLVRY